MTARQFCPEGELKKQWGGECGTKGGGNGTEGRGTRMAHREVGGEVMGRGEWGVCVGGRSEGQPCHPNIPK